MTRTAEIGLSHAHLSPMDRMAMDKTRGREVIRHVIEQARSKLAGSAGQQSDRDRKADLALNALNPAREMADLREAAIAFLAVPAGAMGVPPLELAKRIKAKRDNETAALMALDAYRITASKSVAEATTHEQVEAALTSLQQGAAKALAIAA